MPYTNPGGAADVAIAAAYVMIPLAIALWGFLLRRSTALIGPRIWATCWLFFSFITLCGGTHIVAVLDVEPSVRLTVKYLCAAVSLISAGLIIFIVPEALMLPRYISSLKQENLLLHHFTQVTHAIRSDLREATILEKLRSGVGDMLAPGVLLEISAEAPPEVAHTREIVSLPITPSLAMHLRRSLLTDKQVIVLHNICLEVKKCLEQAATVGSMREELGRIRQAVTLASAFKSKEELQQHIAAIILDDVELEQGRSQ